MRMQFSMLPVVTDEEGLLHILCLDGSVRECSVAVLGGIERKAGNGGNKERSWGGILESVEMDGVC